MGCSGRERPSRKLSRAFQNVRLLASRTLCSSPLLLSATYTYSRMGESTQDDRKESTDTEELNAEKDYVAAAVSRRDWEELRKLSLRPGGFGEDRRDVWYAFYLLSQMKMRLIGTGLSCYTLGRSTTSSILTKDRTKAQAYDAGKCLCPKRMRSWRATRCE